MMSRIKLYATVIILILVSLHLRAEEVPDTVKGWKIGGVLSLTGSQVSFTNWAAGGANSISANSFTNLFANYKRGKMAWDNTLDLGYGLTRQGTGDDVLYYKTDDKIDFSSKYGRYAFEYWYYSALVSFKSQFTKGFKKNTDTIRSSNFLAPGYINISIGMDYKPNDNFTLFMSPLSGKITLVNDTLLSNIGSYGVSPGEIVRYEFGGFVKAQFKANLADNITYTTRLELFSNYLENPQNVDVNWENTFNFKFNSYFSANIHFTMLYDDDTKIAIYNDNDELVGRGARLQMKQLFGLGITYKF
ncbi:MAG: DUF3078 domain-containing protein [Bacteroidales bacterium]|nr:DUF3078 domain-containing protein [Bacteroidales bacterium]